MIPVFITARVHSERLPDKHCFKLPGGLTVIDFIFLRAVHFGFKPLLCVPEDDYDHYNKYTRIMDIFEGDPGNVETRLIEAAHYSKTEVFHHIDGDDPFFSRELVVDSMQCFRMGKFNRVLPCVASASGAGLVGTSYNLAAPPDSTAAVLPDPPAYVYPQRLTLDYLEDFNLLEALCRMGCDFMTPRWAVDDVFRRNPDLYKINWFRTAEWKHRQLDEKSSS